MSLAFDPRSAFWSDYFHKLASADSTSEQLDLSNHAIVVQNYAFVLEACGAIAGKRVLDAGFGTGDFSRILDRLGGDVTAFDMVSTRISQLREEAPTVAWWHDDISTWKQPRHADPFDLVVACETLQYVEFNSAVRRFLDVLSDCGRIVILIPNADCPIVQRVSEQFKNKYVGISLKSLGERLRGVARANYVAYRGIQFQEDQSISPYVSGPWRRISADPARVPTPHYGGSSATVPNRLQIVISRPSKP